MRHAVLYGSILLFCLIISTVKADKKWKFDDENSDSKSKKGARNGEEKNKKSGNSKNKAIKNMNFNFEEEIRKTGKTYQKNDEPLKKSKGKLAKQETDDNSSEEQNYPKHSAKKEIKSGNQQGPKKFIGRIEHGKVMVLRRKEDKIENFDDDSDEDYKEKVCRKSKGGKQSHCEDGINSDEISESSEELSKGKPKKKIKYSIKFQHEKQKKKENNGDISVMRLHKNGKKRYGKDDDDNSSEEDDKPLKRFHLMDDDD